MKKRFLLPILGVTASLALLFAGCGEGKGAEDTEGDGHVGGSSTTDSATTESTADTTGDNAEGGMDNGMDSGMNNGVNGGANGTNDIL